VAASVREPHSILQCVLTTDELRKSSVGFKSVENDLNSPAPFLISSVALQAAPSVVIVNTRVWAPTSQLFLIVRLSMTLRSSPSLEDAL
jgi:hypothetical protein